MRRAIALLLALLLPAMAFPQAASIPATGGTTVIVSGSTAITGGGSTQLCYNQGGFLKCGDAGFTYNETTDIATLLGGLTIGSVTTAGRATTTLLDTILGSSATSNFRNVTGAFNGTLSATTAADRLVIELDNDNQLQYGLWSALSGTGGTLTTSAIFGDNGGAGSIGVGVIGINSGTQTLRAGGFFGLGALVPTGASCALCADNGAVAAAIFIAMDNGTPVFTIADGGAVTATQLITGNAGFDCNINSPTACRFGNNAFGSSRTVYSSAAVIRQIPNNSNGSSLDLALATVNGTVNQLSFSGTTATNLGFGALKLSNSRLALTQATMTLSDTGVYGQAITSCSWTNAMVVALGAALTGDITCATLPAKTRVDKVLVIIDTAAGGPATLTVSCGDAIGGTPFINYIVPSDAKAAAGTIYGDLASGVETGTSLFDATAKWIPNYIPSYTATTLVTCHFIATVANLNATTTSTGHVILTTTLLP